MDRTNSTRNRTIATDWSNIQWVPYIMTIHCSVIILFNLTLLMITRSFLSVQNGLSNLYYAVLLFSQVLVGIAGQMLAVHIFIVHKYIMYEKSFYGVQAFCFYFMNSSYIFTFSCLCLLTIDRITAIYYPYKHATLGKKFFYSSISTTLVLPAIFLMLKDVGNIMAAIFSTTLFVTACVLAGSNYMMYVQVKKHITAILKNCVASNRIELEKEKEKMCRRQLKSLRNCSSMVILHITIWCPAFLQSFISIFLKEDLITYFPWYVWQISLHYSLLYGILAPIVYTWTNKQVKERVKKTFNNVAGIGNRL